MIMDFLIFCVENYNLYLSGSGAESDVKEKPGQASVSKQT